MKDKALFLTKVLELFLQNGAKSMTMDNVAQAFGMSKKTLYQQYQTKEELLKEALNWQLENLVKEMERVATENSCSIRDVLTQSKILAENMKTQGGIYNSCLFTKQLIRYYPNVYSQHQLQTYERVQNMMTENIKKGRLQGVFRYDFDEVLCSKFILQLFFSFDYSPLFEHEKESISTFYDKVFDFFLGSIVTPKGFKILKKHKEKYEE